MTVAVTAALAAGGQGGDLRVHRQHLGLGRRLRRQSGPDLRRSGAAGQDRAGKLAQAIAYGARILQIEGNFDDCLELARKTAVSHQEIALVNSVNPARIEGQKTASPSRSATCWAARRTCTACRSATPGTSPRTGRATASTSATGSSTRCPGCSASRRPVPRRWCSATRCCTRTPSPPRSGSARPPPGTAPSRARDESDGRFDSVTDEQILAAARLLATSEGVFVEPASAASIAGLLATAADGRLLAGAPGSLRRLHRHRQRPEGPGHRAMG